MNQPLLFDDSNTLPLFAGTPQTWAPAQYNPADYYHQVSIDELAALPWRIGEWEIIPVHHAGAEYYTIRKAGSSFCERDYQDNTLIVWPTHAAAADYLSDIECSRYPTPGE